MLLQYLVLILGTFVLLGDTSPVPMYGAHQGGGLTFRMDQNMDEKYVNNHGTGENYINTASLSNVEKKELDLEQLLLKSEWAWIQDELQKVLHNWRLDLDCDVCKVAVTFIQTLLGEGSNNTAIADKLTNFCLEWHIEHHNVCIGMINMYQDEVLTVLRRLDRPAFSPEELCGFTFGDTCTNDPFAMWYITLPTTPKPQVVPPKPPKPGAPVLRVLQLSDIHVDMQYTPGSNPDCHEPLCCRNKSDNGTAGKWGDYSCDIPPWTLENLFQHLNKSEQFDYIIWLGDLPAHQVWMQPQSVVLNDEAYLTDLFQKYFPDKPIFPALGNHEGSPTDSFPLPYLKVNRSMSWLYDALAANWTSNNHWLPKEAVENITKGAYYSVLVKPGFRVVSINMNFCNNFNWWLLLNMTDPGHELNWLIDVLQSAEDNKEKVHILGHIPPGSDSCVKAWSWNYYKIVNRYESTITAQFFGHTHHDAFMMFYDEHNFTRAISTAYIGPSVTTYQHLNPSYRIYVVDGDHKDTSWSVIDHETYILNLTSANEDETSVEWTKEYSAKAAYNLTTLFPADWDHLFKRMNSSQSLFQTYYKYHFASQPQNASCDQGSKCRSQMLCEIRSGRSHDPNLCKYLVEDYEQYVIDSKAMSLC